MNRSCFFSEKVIKIHRGHAADRMWDGWRQNSMSRGKTQLSKPLITQAPRWAVGKGAQLSRGLRTRLPMQGMQGQIPGSGRSPGGGNGNPLQYSGLENPMDREAWWATVHGVERLSDATEQLHSHNQHVSLCFIHFSLNVYARKLIQPPFSFFSVSVQTGQS